MSQKIISPKLAVALVLTGILSGVNTSVAKEREWVIKSNDTLSKIVERYYPSIRNKKAVIRAIVQDNPNAFRRGNAHDLILGKVLILPEPDRFKNTTTKAETDSTASDASKVVEPVAVVEPVNEAPETVAESTSAEAPATNKSASNVPSNVKEKIDELEEGRKELEETLKLVEEENASLQSMVGKYEEQKHAQDAQIAKLEDQVKQLEANLKNTDSTKAVTPAPAVAPVAPVAAASEDSAAISKQLAEKERVTETLKTQLAETKRQNDALQEELQTKITTMESNSSNNLPWIISALLALVMLPLLWLLKQKMQALPTVSVANQTLKKEPVAKPVTQAAAPKVADSLPTATIATPTATVTPVVSNARADDHSDDNLEADIKLDMARAYMDLRNASAAAEILQDVLVEGGARQRQEAREILSFIS
jgi:FimV-like protein